MPLSLESGQLVQFHLDCTSLNPHHLELRPSSNHPARLQLFTPTQLTLSEFAYCHLMFSESLRLQISATSLPFHLGRPRPSLRQKQSCRQPFSLGRCGSSFHLLATPTRLLGPFRRFFERRCSGSCLPSPLSKPRQPCDAYETIGRALQVSHADTQLCRSRPVEAFSELIVSTRRRSEVAVSARLTRPSLLSISYNHCNHWGGKRQYTHIAISK